MPGRGAWETDGTPLPSKRPIISVAETRSKLNESRHMFWNRPSALSCAVGHHVTVSSFLKVNCIFSPRLEGEAGGRLGKRERPGGELRLAVTARRRVGG